jgi:hypothetical protein
MWWAGAGDSLSWFLTCCLRACRVQEDAASADPPKYRESGSRVVHPKDVVERMAKRSPLERERSVKNILQHLQGPFKSIYTSHLKDNTASGDAGQGTMTPEEARRHALESGKLPSELVDALIGLHQVEFRMKHLQTSFSTEVGGVLAKGAESGVHPCQLYALPEVGLQVVHTAMASFRCCQCSCNAPVPLNTWLQGTECSCCYTGDEDWIEEPLVIQPSVPTIPQNEVVAEVGADINPFASEQLEDESTIGGLETAFVGATLPSAKMPIQCVDHS